MIDGLSLFKKAFPFFDRCSKKLFLFLKWHTLSDTLKITENDNPEETTDRE